MHESDRTPGAGTGAGDPDPYRSLVERHSRYAFGVAYRLTGSVEDAEDVVQSAFLKAFSRLSGFEARADFRTWLHRITVNCAIDLIRARRHRELGQDPADLEAGSLSEAMRSAHPAPDRLLLSAEIGAQVRGALARLTPNERAAFMLRHVDGLSIREVAAAMGLHHEAAKNSIFRAVRKMRTALSPLTELKERQA